jgi:hypothetical protein
MIIGFGSFPIENASLSYFINQLPMRASMDLARFVQADGNINPLKFNIDGIIHIPMHAQISFTICFFDKPIGFLPSFSRSSLNRTMVSLLIVCVVI